MTVAQFLEQADSMEITKWFAYFKEKSWREEEQRKSAELQNSLNRR